jgi:D-alanyl-D-alanine carboxypeptidase (penicillin-binding protein 5/6)
VIVVWLRRAGVGASHWPRVLVLGLAVLAAAALLWPPGLAAAREAPKISARAAVVVEARDGRVLFARSHRDRRRVASATKLMTALVSLERLRLRRRLSASPYRAGAAESRINLRPGERMAVVDLMRALLLESANDAAVTLARGAAGSVRAFVQRMNARARRLRLTDTHYANPIGFDEAGNFSSALDLSRLARELLRNDTFATIVDMSSARLATGSRPRVIENRNRLVARVRWIDGVKTGHTLEAGYVLVASGKRKGVRLVSVVLGAPSEAQRDSDTLSLLDHGFGFYRRARVVRAGRELASAEAAFYGDRRIGLTTRRDATVTVRRGERVRTRIEAPDELEGPLERGARVGTVSVFRAGKRVRALPLVTAEPVPGAGAVRKLVDRLLRPWLLAVVVGAGLLVLAARRRRGGQKGGTAPRRVVT